MDADLLMLDADEDGLLVILLVAAEPEDAGNLEDLDVEDGPSPTPIEDLITATKKKNQRLSESNRRLS